MDWLNGGCNHRLGKSWVRMQTALEMPAIIAEHINQSLIPISKC